MRFNVSFDRIGRRRNVGQQTFEAKDRVELETKVLRYVTPMLASRLIEVQIDNRMSAGIILAGDRIAGSFDVTVLTEPECRVADDA